jgi:hypothetical protein
MHYWSKLLRELQTVLNRMARGVSCYCCVQDIVADYIITKCRHLYFCDEKCYLYVVDSCPDSRWECFICNEPAAKNMRVQFSEQDTLLHVLVSKANMTDDEVRHVYSTIESDKYDSAQKMRLYAELAKYEKAHYLAKLNRANVESGVLELWKLTRHSGKPKLKLSFVEQYLKKLNEICS